MTSDFDSQYSGLLSRLSGALNTGIEVLYQVLNNNITFTDNIACTVADVSVQVDSSGKIVGTSSFKLNNTQPVKGVLVIQCTNNSSANAAPTGGVFVTFATNTNNNNNNLSITNVTGLVAGNKYTLRVIALN